MFETAGAYDAYRAAAIKASRRFSMAVLGDLYLKLFRDLVETKGESKPSGALERERDCLASSINLRMSSHLMLRTNHNNGSSNDYRG